MSLTASKISNDSSIIVPSTKLIHLPHDVLVVVRSFLISCEQYTEKEKTNTDIEWLYFLSTSRYVFHHVRYYMLYLKLSPSNSLRFISNEYFYNSVTSKIYDISQQLALKFDYKMSEIDNFMQNKRNNTTERANVIGTQLLEVPYLEVQPYRSYYHISSLLFSNSSTIDSKPKEKVFSQNDELWELSIFNSDGVPKKVVFGFPLLEYSTVQSRLDDNYTAFTRSRLNGLIQESEDGCSSCLSSKVHSITFTNFPKLILSNVFKVCGPASSSNTGENRIFTHRRLLDLLLSTKNLCFDHIEEIKFDIRSTQMSSLASLTQVTSTDYDLTYFNLWKDHFGHSITLNNCPNIVDLSFDGLLVKYREISIDRSNFCYSNESDTSSASSATNILPISLPASMPFFEYKQIQKLTIMSSEKLQDLSIIKFMPMLTDLCLKECNRITNFELLGEETFQRIANIPSHLFSDEEKYVNLPADLLMQFQVAYFQSVPPINPSPQIRDIEAFQRYMHTNNIYQPKAIYSKKYLAYLRSLSRIKYLDISECTNVTPKQIAKLVYIPSLVMKNCDLSIANLQYTSIDDETAMPVMHKIAFYNHYLDLSKNAPKTLSIFGNDELHLNQNHFVHVSCLKLHNCRISGNNIDRSPVPLYHMEDLDLSRSTIFPGNRVTTLGRFYGLRHIARLKMTQASKTAAVSMDGLEVTFIDDRLDGSMLPWTILHPHHFLRLSAASLNYVQSVDLSYSPYVTDISCLKYVPMLNLAGCLALSDVSCLSGGHQISLNLSHCSRITSIASLFSENAEAQQNTNQAAITSLSLADVNSRYQRMTFGSNPSTAQLQQPTGSDVAKENTENLSVTSSDSGGKQLPGRTIVSSCEAQESGLINGPVAPTVAATEPPTVSSTRCPAVEEFQRFQSRLNNATSDLERSEIVKGPKKLRYLNLEGCYRIRDFTCLSKAAEELYELNVSKNEYIQDISHFKGIHRLNIAYCPNISSDSVEKLIDSASGKGLVEELILNSLQKRNFGQTLDAFSSVTIIE